MTHPGPTKHQAPSTSLPLHQASLAAMHPQTSSPPAARFQSKQGPPQLMPPFNSEQAGGKGQPPAPCGLACKERPAAARSWEQALKLSLEQPINSSAAAPQAAAPALNSVLPDTEQARRGGSLALGCDWDQGLSALSSCFHAVLTPHEITAVSQHYYCGLLWPCKQKPHSPFTSIKPLAMLETFWVRKDEV